MGSLCLTPAVVTGVSGFPDSFKKEGLSLTKSHIDNLLYYFSGTDLFFLFFFSTISNRKNGNCAFTGVSCRAGAVDWFRCHKCFQVMLSLSSFMRVGCDGLVLLQRVRKCYEKNVENGEYLQALLLFHFSKNNILGTVSVSAVIHLLSSTFSDLWFFIKTVRVLELFLILIYNPNMISNTERFFMLNNAEIHAGFRRQTHICFKLGNWRKKKKREK